MAVTYSDYINFMQTSSIFQLVAKFEFLNSDETTYQSFTSQVTGGSLNIVRANGVRRTVSINVNNINNLFTPNPLKFWINQKFKLSLGYIINGEPYFIPQGIFGLRSPTTLHAKSEKSASINGIDKFGFLNGMLNGRLEATYNINVNTSVKTAIASSLSLCNDPITPLLIIGADTTPYTIYKEYGNTFGDLLLELNNMLAYNMYYDQTGRFVCEPDLSNMVKGSVWDFTDTSKLYLDIQQSFDFENAYNIVKVIGDNVNGNIATGVAMNNDPTSPLSVLNIGYKLAPIITDAVIDTDQRAQDRANYELLRYASLAVEATINCIPVLHLDVDQVITVTDTEEGLDREKFLINSISLPLDPKGGQVMTIGASKLTDIDFDITNGD